MGVVEEVDGVLSLICYALGRLSVENDRNCLSVQNRDGQTVLFTHQVIGKRVDCLKISAQGGQCNLEHDLELIRGSGAAAGSARKSVERDILCPLGIPNAQPGELNGPDLRVSEQLGEEREIQHAEGFVILLYHTHRDRLLTKAENCNLFSAGSQDIVGRHNRVMYRLVENARRRSSDSVEKAAVVGCKPVLRFLCAVEEAVVIPCRQQIVAVAEVGDVRQ